jgi:hypothetical protein
MVKLSGMELETGMAGGVRCLVFMVWVLVGKGVVT